MSTTTTTHDHDAARLADDGCPHDGRRRFHRRPPAARFWTWERGGYVRLSLRPGQSLAYHAGGPTDEGWTAESTRYTHDGAGIVCEYASDGADCDGRHAAHSESYAPLSALTARDAFEYTNGAAEARGIRTPAWEQGERGQRDYTAEAAGY